VTRAGPPGTRTGLVVALAVLSVALSAAPRVLLASDSLPAAARPFVWSDALATYVERLGGTALPYADAFFEYPPVIGYISGALVRAVPNAALYVAGWAIVCAVAAALVALLLARESGSDAALLWSLSPQLLLFGAMNFDLVAVALLVGAIALSRAAHPRWALAALAAGAVTKAFPALATPPEIARLMRTGGKRAAAAGLALFVAVAGAIAAPSLVARHPATEGIAYVGGLTNFDSAWGLVLAGLRGIGLTGLDGAVALVSAAGMAIMYGFALWRSRNAGLARQAALAMVAVLLWTRLYSPQYSLWLIPFFVLGALAPRAFVVLSLADLAIFATVYPLTLVRWSAGDAAPTVLFAILAVGIVVRHVALVVAWIAAPTRTVRVPSAEGRA
jgi:hypothetical protein